MTGPHDKSSVGNDERISCTINVNTWLYSDQLQGQGHIWLLYGHICLVYQHPTIGKHLRATI